MTPRRLLAIVELGGYPNLLPLYQKLGFKADWVTSQRKARNYLKQQQPDLVVAEYNYQTDFRDRSSNLETLAAVLQRYPEVKLWSSIPGNMKPTSRSSASSIRYGGPSGFRSRRRRWNRCCKSCDAAVKIVAIRQICPASELSPGYFTHAQEACESC